MNDPYVYPGTDVLVNHFDIRDEARLGRVERLITVEAMVEIMRRPSVEDFSFATLVDIHRDLFRDIYPFAGEIRSVELSKPEGVLSGRSVRYGHPAEIHATAHAAISTLQGVDYGSMSGERDWEVFAEGLATLWRSHAFREGNTRSILLFAERLLKAKGCPVDFSVISQAPADTRDELVRASEGYGRGLAMLFREARASCVRRSHPTFGFLPAPAADMLEEVSSGRDVPSRLAEPGDAVRGSVLFEANGNVVIQTSKGLIGVAASSFASVPQGGQRISLVVESAEIADEATADYELHRRIRNAILADPHRISIPSNPDDLMGFPFTEPDLHEIASNQPGMVSEIAARVLQGVDPAAWEDWKTGGYATSGAMLP